MWGQRLQDARPAPPKLGEAVEVGGSPEQTLDTWIFPREHRSCCFHPSMPGLLTGNS